MTVMFGMLSDPVDKKKYETLQILIKQSMFSTVKYYIVHVYQYIYIYVCIITQTLASTLDF